VRWAKIARRLVALVDLVWLVWFVSVVILGLRTHEPKKQNTPSVIRSHITPDA
jgi:hypothetical protein